MIEAPALLFALLLPALPTPGSAVAIDPLGRGTWLVDAERNEVALFPTEKSRELRRFGVGDWPEELTVGSDGTVFVSCRGAARVDVIHPSFETTSIAVGREPRTMLLDEEHQRLYVGLVTARSIVLVDTKTSSVIAERTIDSAPRAIALTNAGLAVAGEKSSVVRFLSPDLGDHGVEGTSIGSDITVDLGAPREGRRAWHIQRLVPAPSAHKNTGGKGHAADVDGDGNDLLVIHASVDTGMAGTTFFEGYGSGVEQPIAMGVSVIHAPPSPEPPALRGFAGELHVLDVQGAVYDDGLLVLASRGTKQILTSAIDLNRVRVHPGFGLPFGNGMAGLARGPDGSLATLLAFDRKLTTVHVDKKSKRLLVATLKQTSIGEGSLDKELALGRALFHDGTNELISMSTIACATCHPDGREDGLVWRVQRNHRQTPFLAGRLGDTAPYNWEGTTKTLEANIAQTVERLNGMGLSPKKRHAIARYIVEGLHAPDDPKVDDEALVAEGARVFASTKAGCARCHSGDGMTDGERYDVGTTGNKELSDMAMTLRFAKIMRMHPTKEIRINTKNVKAPEYNTPSLRHLALTAPYLHDGSASTLEELIANNDDRMGVTSTLTDEERRALVAYLSSI